jgi:hypothetical protein
MNIPSSERSKDTKGTTSSQEASVGTTSAAVLQVCEAEEQECQVKRKEEGEESDGRAESPKESRNGFGESASSVDAIWKPPGVRMMAVPIQKPPYEARAVAPKVLPSAISLWSVRSATHFEFWNEL